LVTMLRFANANPHVASMQPPTRRSGVGDRVRLSVAGPPRLECPLPSTPEGAGSGEQLASRPCSTDESVAASPPLPVTKRSFLPWALVPFKVLRLPLLPDEVSGKRLAHSEERACAPNTERMVVHPLAAREESLCGFPLLLRPEPKHAAGRGDHDGRPAARLFSATAGPRSATRRATCCQGRPAGRGLQSLSGCRSSFRCLIRDAAGACETRGFRSPVGSPAGYRYRPSWGL
jgi:hypothetical protein